MAIAKVKSISVNTGLGDTLNGCLFDPELAYKKYWRILDVMERYCGIAKFMSDQSFLFENPDGSINTTTRANYAAILTMIRACIDKYTSIEASAATCSDASSAASTAASSRRDFALFTNEEKDHFIDSFKELRADKCLKVIFAICDLLHPYKSHISNMDTLQGFFLENMPGGSFTPIAGIDIKDIYIRASSKPNVRTMVLLFLHKIYTYGYQLFTEYTAPDMNVESFVNTVSVAMGELRRVPELSRCGEALSKIDNSLDMLRERFGTYYLDYMQTQSPTTILENFILDMAADAKSGHVSGAGGETTMRKAKPNVRLAQQFQHIVAYYRKVAQNQPINKNPKVRALFETFEESQKSLGLQNLGQK